MNEIIQWNRAEYWDRCWNPWIGCRPISAACKNCYAAALSKRFKTSFEPHETNQRPPRSKVVFCGNMTDLFGEWLDPVGSASLVSQTLGYSHKAKYLWLTKRPDNMCDALNRGVLNYQDEDGEHQSPFFDCEFCNQYFGFTAENQEWYEKRFELFFRYKPLWAQCWLSAEPLLGPIDLRIGKFPLAEIPFRWVVVGCESGPKRRPCKIEWVESIVNQCMRDIVPVFVKQLDIGGKCVTDIAQFPKHLQIRQFPWGVSNA